VTPAARSLFLPGLFATVALVILLSLGTWQVQRLAWKTDLIAKVEARTQPPAAPLPPRTDWDRLSEAADEFRRVAVTLRFDPGAEAFVYGALVDPATGTTRGGAFVLTPATTADGGRLLVNRGFVPDDRKEPATRPPVPAGDITLEAIIRFPQARTAFDGADDIARNLFFVRDPGVIAAARGWGPVAPFYLAEVGPTPGRLPAAQPPKVDLRNNHLGYAITWYGLAASLIGVFAVFAAARLRKQPA
jgi:surfeit locus 1 family protein